MKRPSDLIGDLADACCPHFTVPYNRRTCRDCTTVLERARPRIAEAAAADLECLVTQERNRLLDDGQLGPTSALGMDKALTVIRTYGRNRK